MRTLGADRGYDTKDCVKAIRSRRVTPHVTQKQHSAIDGHTTRHAGYAVSIRIRKRVEEVFNWMKTVGSLRRSRYRGVARTGLVATAYNLFRMARRPHRRPSPCRPDAPPRTPRASIGRHRACRLTKPARWETHNGFHGPWNHLHAASAAPSWWRIPSQTHSSTDHKTPFRNRPGYTFQASNVSQPLDCVSIPITEYLLQTTTTLRLHFT